LAWLGKVVCALFAVALGRSSAGESCALALIDFACGERLPRS
jgi:hypothetical protein